MVCVIFCDFMQTEFITLVALVIGCSSNKITNMSFCLDLQEMLLESVGNYSLCIVGASSVKHIEINGLLCFIHVIACKINN